MNNVIEIEYTLLVRSRNSARSRIVVIVTPPQLFTFTRKLWLRGYPVAWRLEERSAGGQPWRGSERALHGARSCVSVGRVFLRRRSVGTPRQVGLPRLRRDIRPQCILRRTALFYNTRRDVFNIRQNPVMTFETFRCFLSVTRIKIANQFHPSW